MNTRKNSSIVVCECGAKVRLRPADLGRAIRCPACEQFLAVDAGGHVVASTMVATNHSCQICQSSVAGEPGVTCPDCQQVQHRDCWGEVGGCGTYGCRHAPSIDKSPQSASAPLTAWGDTKICPACSEEIKSIALRCRYCDTEFDSVDPMTLRDLKRQTDRSDTAQSTRNSIIAAFVVSAIGCAAPLMLCIWIGLLATRKQEIQKAGPQFSVMTWAGLGLSGIYTVLMLFFFLTDGL